MRDRALLGLSLLAILLVTAPWGQFVGHAHWSRVSWAPLAGLGRAGDAAANLLLYIPAGWSAARLWRTRRADVAIIVAAAGVSAAMEYLQVWSHGRFPTMTDLLMNTVGAAVGVWLVRRGGRTHRS